MPAEPQQLARRWEHGSTCVLGAAPRQAMLTARPRFLLTKAQLPGAPPPSQRVLRVTQDASFHCVCVCFSSSCRQQRVAVLAGMRALPSCPRPVRLQGKGGLCCPSELLCARWVVSVVGGERQRKRDRVPELCDLGAEYLASWKRREK